MAVHVLIVDADPSAALVTSAVVKRIAPEAIIVCEPVLDRVQLSMQLVKPDVLVIDPALQPFGALHLLQFCKEFLPTIRVIVLTSAPTPALRAAVQNLGIEVYLEKPATLSQLVDKLHPVLVAPKEVATTRSLPAIQHS